MNMFKRYTRFAKVTALSAAIGTSLVLGCPATQPAQAEESGQKVFEQLQEHITNVSSQVRNTVVHIEVISKRGEQHSKSMGSGLLISADGRIVTNYHVIDRASTITVILDDKTKYEAKVLRSDQPTDLALIKIDCPNPLPFSTLSDSDQVKVGQWVIAIGNPYGFDQTVSFGIVSGKGRFIPGVDNGVPLINDFIQTDALIDPGNSGGPLVNLEGKVVGINSVGIGRGQGFTIPANIVKQMLNRTEVHGRIQRGWLGVFVQQLSEEYAKYLGIPDVHGILVSDCNPGSPAAKAGFASGDIITKFADIPINGSTDEAINRFILAVASLEPGTKVPVSLLRQGKTIEKTVVIGTQPPTNAEEIGTQFGITVQQITQSVQQEYRLEDTLGVLVLRVTKGSAASEADLTTGDVITKVENTPIKSTADFKRVLPQLEKKNCFQITYKRGLVTRFAFVDLTPFRSSEK